MRCFAVSFTDSDLASKFSTIRFLTGIVTKDNLELEHFEFLIKVL